jgi:hypothetical protein
MSGDQQVGKAIVVECRHSQAHKEDGGQARPAMDNRVDIGPVREELLHTVQVALASSDMQRTETRGRVRVRVRTRPGLQEPWWKRKG